MLFWPSSHIKYRHGNRLAERQQCEGHRDLECNKLLVYKPTRAGDEQEQEALAITIMINTDCQGARVAEEHMPI